MRKRHLRNGVALLAAVLVSTAAPSLVEAQWSAEPSAPEPAAMNVFGQGIDFFPSVSHGGAILTISGGDVLVRQVFEAGERPSIGLTDSEGNRLPDGAYTWQLELRPDAAARASLRVAASRNGGKAPNSWLPQSGAFVIQGGSIASPSASEAGSVLENSSASGLSAASPGSFRSSSFRASEDSDASGVSEAQVRAVAARTATAMPFGAGLQVAVSVGPDSDGAVATGQAMEVPFAVTSMQSSVASRASIPQRAVEPGGKNGRPERKE